MGLRIRTNIASLNAQRRLNETTDETRQNMAKLASGRRINRSADDAAGLAMATKMDATVRSLSQAKRNASDLTPTSEFGNGNIIAGGDLSRIKETHSAIFATNGQRP